MILVGLYLFLRAGGPAVSIVPTATTAPTATNPSPPTAPPAATPSQPTPAPAVVETVAPTATVYETIPPATDTPTTAPSPTVAPAARSARINSITLDGDRYVVDYQTYEYTEVLPGVHVHFFFDTVSPDNAGVPGSGPWYLYGGPRPFRGYGTGDRPQGATQMCVLVANEDHSVQPNSGNCAYLP